MIAKCSAAVRRGLAAVLVAAALVASAGTGSVAAARTFDVSGTVVSIQRPNLVILTNDISGRSTPITVDVSFLKDLQVKVGDPIQLTVVARESNTYLALGVEGEGNFVSGLDFGARPEFLPVKGSIEAHVGNGPVDDEALAQRGVGKNLRAKNED